jgi:hypothetical protein
MASFFRNVVSTVKKAAKDTGKTVAKAAKDTGKTVAKAGKDVVRAEVKAVKDTGRAVLKAGKDTVVATKKAATDTARETVRVAKSDLGQAILIGAVTGGAGLGAVAIGKKVARTLGGRAVATTVAQPKEVATVESTKEPIHTDTTMEEDRVLNVNRDKPRALAEVDRTGNLTTAPVTRAEVREHEPDGGGAGDAAQPKTWWLWLPVLGAVVLLVLLARSGQFSRRVGAG